MPRRPKPKFVIVQRLDYVTCNQQQRGRPSCGVLVTFMPGELPTVCANRHPQRQYGKAYFTERNAV
jgi:hypothetical protein